MKASNLHTPQEQERIEDLLQQLWKKYDSLGQDLPSYLEGLLYADVLTYWDYIQLDTLLSLQKPRTSFPDEQIFIIYHQTTELYFKLIRSEIDQIVANFQPEGADFLMRIKRVNKYFEVLTSSFDVMVDGMDPEQFLKFRMSLLPASGFQSAQFRMVELMSTDLDLLLLHAEEVKGQPISEKVAQLYWRQGATELGTGKKTLTLKMFIARYMKDFIKLASNTTDSNLYALYRRVGQQSDNHTQLVQELRRYDALVNINWRFVHYKSAVRYLHKEPEQIAATGGTNWQKYLPPRFQQRVFFPSLWAQDELDTWGHRYLKELLTIGN